MTKRIFFPGLSSSVIGKEHQTVQPTLPFGLQVWQQRQLRSVRPLLKRNGHQRVSYESCSFQRKVQDFLHTGRRYVH